VRVGSADGEALVEIRDSGPGIPPEHRAKVFERFYRVDDARTRDAGGAGLGLSIAEWAVRAHGGKIELECDSQPGCTFRIRLPTNST
jgi:two-component system OmpR family sensor kinase